MTLNPDQYRLDEAKHQAIFEQRIKPDLFASATSVNYPVAVILGGQPGSGKSALIRKALNEMKQRGGAIQIEGDALRDYHLAYSRLLAKDDKTAAFYTDRDTGHWVEKAIAYAKEQQVNLVIEGIMRSPEVVAATMQSLREAGYTIDARALAVNWRLSEQGIIQRYENQKMDRSTGRMTTPEAHKAAFDGMLSTLERIENDKLADSLTIYRRGGEAIYSNTLENGRWQHEPQARAVVAVERARPMTLQEHQAYAKGFDRLLEMVTKPERKADAEDIQRIENLKNHADAALQQAQAAEREQRALLEQASPTSAVSAHESQKKLYVEAKHQQVERIEDKLRSLISTQQTKIQQLQANSPRWLARPSVKRTFNAQLGKQQSHLQCLEQRLSSVLAIKTRTNPHAPTVEALAAQKLRREQPELIRSRDAELAAKRLRELKAQDEQREKQRQEQAQRQGRSLSQRLKS